MTGQCSSMAQRGRVDQSAQASPMLRKRPSAHLEHVRGRPGRTTSSIVARPVDLPIGTLTTGDRVARWNGATLAWPTGAPGSDPARGTSGTRRLASPATRPPQIIAPAAAPARLRRRRRARVVNETGEAAAVSRDSAERVWRGRAAQHGRVALDDDSRRRRCIPSSRACPCGNLSTRQGQRHSRGPDPGLGQHPVPDRSGPTARGTPRGRATGAPRVLGPVVTVSQPVLAFRPSGAGSQGGSTS